MPEAYASAQAAVDNRQSAKHEAVVDSKSERETTRVESLSKSDKRMSPEHARATALYDIPDQHMDTLEDKMGEDRFADLDELADEIVELSERNPETATVKRGLIEVEDALRKHLGDEIVDAALED